MTMASEEILSRARRYELAREHLLSAMAQYRQALHAMPPDAWAIAPWDRRVLIGMRDLLAFLEVQEGNRGKARIRRMWRAADHLSDEELNRANSPLGAARVDNPEG